MTVLRRAGPLLGLLCLVLSGCRREALPATSGTLAPPLRSGPPLLTPGAAPAEIPPSVRLGGAIVDREDCRQCHRILGEGGRRGPELTGLSGRRDRAWLVGHLKEPKKFTPGSKMPSFRELSEDEIAAIADYLLALP